jgi:hypothetical protein
VLGVDRHDLPFGRCGRHQFTTDDQRFLVGECQCSSGLQSREGRTETDRSRDRVEHDIRLDVTHQLLGLLRTQCRVLDLELRGLLPQHLGIAAC